MKELRILFTLVKRNIKLYFKDKGVFFLSLITPLILLVLFVSFLGNVYKSSLNDILGVYSVSDKLVNAFCGGWLLSSILGVCCITIAFCSNIQVYDKISGCELDLNSTPTSKKTIFLSYFFANLFTTLIVCFVAMLIGFIYLAIVGWYMSFSNVLLIVLDVVMCTMFGSLLASIIMSFISNQGGLSTISTLVSSLYGFLCGAYMPLSQLSAGIRNIVMFIPGTYGVVLLRNHYMNDVFNEMSKSVPDELIEAVRDSFDGNAYFFNNKVEMWQMYLILGVSIVVLLGVFVLIARLKNKKSGN